MPTTHSVTYTHEEGASSTWTFKATTNRTVNKEAVVKVYCLPVSKVTKVMPIAQEGHSAILGSPSGVTCKRDSLGSHCFHF